MKEHTKIDQASYDNIMAEIKKEQIEFDAPKVDAKLDAKFGKQNFVGTSSMKTEAQKKENQRRANMRTELLDNLKAKREEAHFEIFGGRHAVVKSLKAQEATIKESQNAQTKKAKEIQKQQTPKKRQQETARSVKTSSTTDGKGHDAKVQALKEKYNSNVKQAKSAGKKSKTKAKTKSSGKTK